MNLTKDTYEYILNFADDREILNMLSVNKKFRNEELFEKVLKRKYPELLQYKKDESFQDFFIKMIFYISYLKEKFDIPYFGMDPKYLYDLSKKYPPLNFYGLVMVAASRRGDLNVVKAMIDKGVRIFDNALYTAARGGHLNIVKYFIEKGENDYSSIGKFAAANGHTNIIDYLLENKYVPISKLNNFLVHAADGGHLDLVKHLISLGASDILSALDYARMGNQKEVIDYLESLD